MDELVAQKRLHGFILYWTLTYSRFTVTGCASVSAFSILLGVSIGITSSATGLKICTINSGSKKYKSIINKNNKSMIE